MIDPACRCVPVFRYDLTVEQWLEVRATDCVQVTRTPRGTFVDVGHYARGWFGVRYLERVTRCGPVPAELATLYRDEIRDALENARRRALFVDVIA